MEQCCSLLVWYYCNIWAGHDENSSITTKFKIKILSLKCDNKNMQRQHTWYPVSILQRFAIMYQEFEFQVKWWYSTADNLNQCWLVTFDNVFFLLWIYLYCVLLLPFAVNIVVILPHYKASTQDIHRSYFYKCCIVIITW